MSTRVKTSVHLDRENLLALDTFKLMIKETDAVRTTTLSRSSIINDAVRRYLLKATKKFVEKYGENDLAEKILSLIENPIYDTLWLWGIPK